MLMSQYGLRAVALLSALVAVFFFTATNQAQAGTIATPTGKGVGGPIDGTIAGSPRHVNFAGLIKVTVDGTPTFAYCIDINSPLQMNQTHDEGDWSEANVANLAKITRILQQRPADATVARGDAVEAAAVQAAIWHFSDGFNLTSGSAGVVAAYNQIVADANANPAAEPVTSLDLDPAQRNGTAGDHLSFELRTSATGSVSLTVAPSGGAQLVTCDAAHTPIGASISGPYPRQLCLYRATAGGPISLNATATAVAAAGRVFLRQGSQKLVLAGSRTVESHASSTATWAAAPVNRAPSVSLTCPSGGFVYGQSASFTAVGQDADGDSLTYAWQKNGIALAGTGNTVTATLQAGDVLTVRVTDSKGAMSAPATLSETCGQAPPATPPTSTPPAATPAPQPAAVVAAAPAVVAAPVAAPAPAVVSKPVVKAKPKAKAKQVKAKAKKAVKATVKKQATAKKTKPRVLPFTP